MARSRNLTLGIGFALLALILLTLGWWLAKGEPDGRLESTATVVAGDREDTGAMLTNDRPDASALVATQPASGPEGERELFRASAEDELPPVEATLEGQLVFPPRTPEDETLEVLCLTQLATRKSVFDWTFSGEETERQVFHHVGRVGHRRTMPRPGRLDQSRLCDSNGRWQ